jgi:hypothetical protein
MSTPLTAMARPHPRRWRKRLRELTELFLLPVAATLLPWRITLRLMRYLSRYRGWYYPEISLSTEYASRSGLAPDREAFARRLRWRLLVEHMDCFLVPMRGRRYIDRWVRAAGDPLPATGPVLFVGTHYGCGYWFLPYLRSRGLPLNIVAPQLGPLLSRSSLQENLYVRLRHRLIARAAGRPMVYRGNAAAAIGELLQAGEVGFALADMPTNRRDAVPVTLAGLPTRLAQNMFELAAREHTPVYIFWSDTDLVTGIRHIHFKRLADDTPEQQTREFAAMLSGLIENEPAGWRFWSIAPSFFALPAAAET